MNHTKMDRTPTPELLDEAVRIRISADNHHGVYKIRDLLKALAYCDELDKRPAKEAGKAGGKVIGERIKIATALKKAAHEYWESLIGG